MHGGLRLSWHSTFPPSRLFLVSTRFGMAHPPSSMQTPPPGASMGRRPQSLSEKMVQRMKDEPLIPLGTRLHPRITASLSDRKSVV